MFKDGLPSNLLDIHRDGGGNIQLFRLDMWVQTWNYVRPSATTIRQYPEAEGFVHAIDYVGLSDGVRNQSLTFALDDLEYPPGYMGNPFKLLVASKHRTTIYEEDRVYGIMQVFDLRLGKSAPGASGENFRSEELRTQLAAAVLVKYTVLSQLIIQHEDCKPNKAWMISPSISLPEEAYRAWSHTAFGGEVIYKTSLRMERFQDTAWARFSGPMSPFQAWYTTMKDAVESLNTRLLIDRGWIKKLPAAWEFAPSSDNLKAKSQMLLATFDGLSVIFLGRLIPPHGIQSEFDTNDFYDWGVGLLLAPAENKNAECYHRIGVLIWDLGWMLRTRNPAPSEDVANYLNGKTNRWVPSSGLFG